MIREAISKLVSRQRLTRDDAYGAMREIMSGEATPAQIAAYITALRFHGETREVIAGSAAAMREVFTAIPAPSEIVVDTCGTGGDGAHTINVSTAAAIVASGAGCCVAKHGNRAVSSRCGSADVLAELGVKIDCPPEIMTQCLANIGLAFLFAPLLHPAMKYAIGPRREIGIRSIFNILGPLSNPAGARYGVLGVYDAELVPVLAEAACDLGSRHLFVVHGMDGLDELTTTTESLVAEVNEGRVRTFRLDPLELGIPRADPADLAGGSPAENAETIRSVLAGKKGPARDIVVLNAAAAILAGGRATSWNEAIESAKQSIDSGRAAEKLSALIRETQSSA